MLKFVAGKLKLSCSHKLIFQDWLHVSEIYLQNFSMLTSTNKLHKQDTSAELAVFKCLLCGVCPCQRFSFHRRRHHRQVTKPDLYWTSVNKNPCLACYFLLVPWLRLFCHNIYSHLRVHLFGPLIKASMASCSRLVRYATDLVTGWAPCNGKQKVSKNKFHSWQTFENWHFNHNSSRQAVFAQSTNILTYPILPNAGPKYPRHDLY